jgi:hypothetical protein
VVWGGAEDERRGEETSDDTVYQEGRLGMEDIRIQEDRTTADSPSFSV